MRPTPIPPGSGQESVWDYPRPPVAEPTGREVVIRFGGVEIVRTWRAVRLLETSHPPVYYLPIEDFMPGVLRPSAQAGTVCEWKGRATYYDVVAPGRTGEGGGADARGTDAAAGGRIERAAAWGYPDPVPSFALLAGRIAVYPGRMDACSVDGEPVTPQPGGFYGGWITPDVVGPFKGGPGTWGW